MPTTKLGKCTWGAAEVGAVLVGALHLTGPEKARASLAASLGDLGYRGSLFLLNRGSLGLRLALEEMRAQRPGRSVVVIPAYCCPSVPRTARALGFQLRAAPVGADLNLDLDRIAPLLDRDVLAVVGVHMYALPLDMARLRLLALQAGAYVVDDAAHAVEHAPANRPPLGLAGDVGLLSFNQSKTLTGGSPNGGGALIVADEELRHGIARRYDALAEGKSRARNYVWFALRYAVEITPRALVQYIDALYDPIEWLTGAEHERAERMSASAALAVRAQIARLRQITDGRTALVAHYLNALAGRPEIEFVQTKTPRYLSRMFVRWRKGPLAPEIRETLTRRGFATRTSYPLWTANDDPTAACVRDIRATHLELAGSPRLTKEKVEELVSGLALCLKSQFS